MDRIELRSHRRLYGVIVGGTALVVQHGREMLAFDLQRTLAEGVAIIIDRVLHPDDEPEERPCENPVE